VLFVYNDTRSPYQWAPGLVAAAKKRGTRHKLLRQGDDSYRGTVGYFFGRCEQRAEVLPHARGYCQRVATWPGITSVIAPREYLHYERKDLQALEFAHFMPETWNCTRKVQTHAALDALGLPLISKSNQGSSSSNVRLIETREQALLEASLALGAQGLQTARGVQKGYVLWQRYLAQNDYAYRVVRIGGWYWLLRIFNRDDKPMASGSGKFEAIERVHSGSQELDVLRWAHDFCEQHAMRWVGLDIISDPRTGAWRLLETTLAWNLRAKGANEACAVMNEHGELHPNGYHGRDQWALLLDEIEQGVFG